LQQSACDRLVDPDFVFDTGEPWFHVSVYVKCGENRYWRAEKTHCNHEVPIYDVKIGVWCLVSALIE
jgi:hypothetical protein